MPHIILIYPLKKGHIILIWDIFYARCSTSMSSIHTSP